MSVRVDFLVCFVLSVISAISVSLVVNYRLPVLLTAFEKSEYFSSGISMGISMQSTDLNAKADPGSRVINRFFGVLRL